MRTVSREPAPAHSLDVSQISPAWSKLPDEVMATQPGDKGHLQIYSLSERSQTTIASFPVPVVPNTDYLFRMPVRLDRGNLVISILNQGEVLSTSPVLHPLETSAIIEPQDFMLEVPFVNREAGEVLVVLSNEGKRPVETHAQAGKLELFRLGASSLNWTKYVRFVIHAGQSLFLTALILPIAVLGLLLLLAAGQDRFLLVLLTVPAYYFCTQSFLHTEYRYVMAIQYSLFVLAAAALYWLTTTAIRRLNPRSRARLR